MTKRMLIDATHDEETRVAIIDGNRLDEYDYESKFRKPLKGSIFLAKVTRVEPSLQAAFVNFGGNRHGFLPFSEIHPDYFRIPIADREALLAEQEAAMGEDEDEDEDHEEGKEAGDNPDDVEDLEEEIDGNVDPEDDNEGNTSAEEDADEEQTDNRGRRHNNNRGRRGGKGRGRGRAAHRSRNNVESFGGEEYEGGEKRSRFNLRRKYKIQEVIKRGQIMLIQVSKEERGNKGAAVSSYLSLPGRYCVLMPNSPRGGGVSRKIAHYKDRARMREIVKDLSLPKGMSVIVRTAGVTRTKAEIKRDLDYLMRLWDNIRELTLESSAPAMVYEEADLIKRAIRDLYTRDVEEIYVSGEEGFQTAKNFMKMMTPSHIKRIHEYKGEDGVPLFNRYKVETQIAETSEPEVTLPSGGYLVINPTEALVSIDVNSGKSTKERHIEETALKTNLETAEEVARQLRLRDLGGLIVIDFIDMEDRRNNGKVERKMREALSTDRARIQMGRISSFGLMELSRQRLNPSLTESQFESCVRCSGMGRVRTADATSIMVLRAIEEEGMKARAAQVIVHVSSDVAVYILNHKRKNLAEIEERYGFTVLIRVDESIGASSFRVEVAKPSPRDGDEEESNENKKDDRKPSGRKRGRRGGRGRGRRDNAGPDKDGQSFADDLNQDLEPDGETQEEEKPSQARARGKKSDDHDKNPPKRTRKPAAKKKDEDKAGDTDSKKPDVKSGDDKPDKKPVRQAAAKKSKETSVPAAGKKEEKKEENKKSSSPSNDHKTEKEPPVKEYETVNEAPSKKKKGWWNR